MADLAVPLLFLSFCAFTAVFYPPHVCVLLLLLLLRGAAAYRRILQFLPDATFCCVELLEDTHKDTTTGGTHGCTINYYSSTCNSCFE
jgi:hypothetical protein